MSRRKPPAAHTWADGGGMVVRCEDPEMARPLMVEAYREEHGQADPDDGPEDDELFPVSKSRVERGRMLGALPGSWIEYEGWSWAWYPDDREPRGTTLAVVWSTDR